MLGQPEALNCLEKGEVPTLAGVIDPVLLDYKYGYANYMAAKALIDRVGFTGVKELLIKSDRESELPGVFAEIAGCSMDEFDYIVRNALKAELARETEPVMIKVRITEEGYLPGTLLTVGTSFAEKKTYLLEVTKPGEYNFLIASNGEITTGSGNLTDVSVPEPSDQDTIYDAFVAIDFPDKKFTEENLIFSCDRGLLYPVSNGL